MSDKYGVCQYIMLLKKKKKKTWEKNGPKFEHSLTSSHTAVQQGIDQVLAHLAETVETSGNSTHEKQQRPGFLVTLFIKTRTEKSQVNVPTRWAGKNHAMFIRQTGSSTVKYPGFLFLPPSRISL